MAVLTGTVEIDETSTTDVSLRIFSQGSLGQRVRLSSFLFDGTNLTKNGTVKVFVNIGPSGETQRELEDMRVTVLAGKSVNIMQTQSLETDSFIEIKFASDGGGTGQVNIYYRFLYESFVTRDALAKGTASWDGSAFSVDGDNRFIWNPGILPGWFNTATITLLDLAGGLHSYRVSDYIRDVSPGIDQIFITGSTDALTVTDYKFELHLQPTYDFEHVSGEATRKSDVLMANASTASANSTNILARIGSFTGTGVNTILGFFKALFSKEATTPSDIGGTFQASTDSVEALQEELVLIEQNLQSVANGVGETIGGINIANGKLDTIGTTTSDTLANTEVISGDLTGVDTKADSILSTMALDATVAKEATATDGQTKSKENFQVLTEFLKPSETANIQ